MPVAAGQSYRELLGVVDDVICLEMPSPFQAVHVWYRDFSEVSDLDVRRLYAEARTRLEHWPFMN